MSNALIDRRRFVQFLVASPLLGTLGSLASPGQSRAAQGLRGQSIESPDNAINVFDLEAVAAESLPPAHFGYIQTGGDGDLTLRANEETFGNYYLRKIGRTNCVFGNVR
jgi:4-hydroxymandelate oxidase